MSVSTDNTSTDQPGHISGEPVEAPAGGLSAPLLSGW